VRQETAFSPTCPKVLYYLGSWIIKISSNYVRIIPNCPSTLYVALALDPAFLFSFSAASQCTIKFSSHKGRKTKTKPDIGEQKLLIFYCTRTEFSPAQGCTFDRGIIKIINTFIQMLVEEIYRKLGISAASMMMMMSGLPHNKAKLF